MDFKISIDIGLESIKMAYAFKNGKGVVCHGINFDNANSYPAVAFYDANNDNWIFGKNALYGANSSQKPIVKIKELLALIDDDNAYNSNQFENKACGYKFIAKTLTVSQLVDKFFENLFHTKLAQAFVDMGIGLSGHNVEMVFSFPSKYSDKSKQVVKALLEKHTGYNVRSVAEPIAASMCCFSEGSNILGNTLIVDMGVNESSLVLMNMNSIGGEQKKQFDCVETIDFGGNDYDKVIYDYITSVSTSREALSFFQQYILFEDIKNCKKMLCEGMNEVFIEYQSYAIENIILTKEKFAQISKTLTQNYASAIVDYIKRAKRVDNVLLTGGTSRNTLLVQEIQKQIKSFDSFVNVNIGKSGELSVAKGAGIFATDAYHISSISTKCYGVECYDKNVNGMSVMIGKNTPLPAIYISSFFTQQIAQKVEICIRCSDLAGKQKDHIKAIEKTQIILDDKLFFSSIRPSNYKVEIKIEIDENGIGIVTARGESPKEVITSRFRAK